MHKLYAMNWILEKQLILHTLHTMDRVVVLSGLIIYNVLVMNKQLETVHIQDGEIIIIVIMVKMLVLNVVEVCVYFALSLLHIIDVEFIPVFTLYSTSNMLTLLFSYTVCITYMKNLIILVL